jgi:glutathione S-transferase
VRQDAPVRIFHIATLADWKQAEASGGTYTTSTYGVPLAEAGFIHASRHEQVRGVLDRVYGDVTEPLLILEIETDLLGVPWREDDVDGETFPHIYGPLNTRAVVRWRPARLPPFEPPPVVVKHPEPPVVNAFYGLTVVLGTTAVALAVAGLIADAQAHGDSPTLPHSTEFLVWTLAAGCGLATVASLAVGWLLHSRARRHRAQAPADS